MTAIEAVKWLKDEGKAVKHYPITFIVSVLLVSSVFTAGVYWLVDHLYSAQIAADDRRHEADDAAFKNVSQERDAANRDNDRLRAENAAYRAGHDDKSLPLKKRTLILADQLEEYKSRFKDPWTRRDTLRLNQLSSEWDSRFKNRVYVAEGQLDENGQHSEKLEGVYLMDFYNSDPTPTVELIASELKRLAEALPDNP